MQLRMGSHALPVEQGRLARPAIPRHLRRCKLFETRALRDERNFVFDCPHFAHIRRQFRSLYQDADGTMQCFVWHKDQRAVCHYSTAILNLADDSNQDASWLKGLIKFSLSLPTAPTDACSHKFTV